MPCSPRRVRPTSSNIFQPRVETLEARDLLSYTLTDLGTFGGASSSAIALNSRGQVLLYAHDSFGNTTGAFLSNGRAVHVPTPPDGYAIAAPLVLANDGTVAGRVFDAGGNPQYPAIFGEDGMPGYTLDGQGYVAAMNASGDAVGVSDGQSVLWHDGEIVATMPVHSYPVAMNDAGIAAGNYNGQLAAEWIDGVMTLLDAPDGAQGYVSALSSDGRMAGKVAYVDAQGNYHEHAAAWDVDGFHELTVNFIPRGINRYGAIVADDGLRDASGFHPWSELWPNAGWAGQAAVGINDRGQIAGTASAPDGHYHAYILTPDRSFELAVALAFIQRHVP